MDYFNGSEAIKFIRKFENLKSHKNTKIISLTCHEDLKIIDFINFITLFLYK